MSKCRRFSVLALALATPLSSLAADVEFESTVAETCELVITAPQTKDNIMLEGKTSGLAPLLAAVKTNSTKDRTISITNVRPISGTMETGYQTGIFTKPMNATTYGWYTKEVDVSSPPAAVDFDWNSDRQQVTSIPKLSAGKQFAIVPGIRYRRVGSGTIKVAATITAKCT